MIKQSEAETSSSVNAIDAKSLALHLNFKEKEPRKLQHWVYLFKNRRKLRCTLEWPPKRVKNIVDTLLSVHEKFSEMIRFKFRKGDDYETVSSSLFVNTDETAVFFGARLKSTVHVVEHSTVSVKCTEGNNKSMKVCISVAFDGTKLPLFVIFKNHPSGKIVETLRSTVPNIFLAAVRSRTG